MYQDSVFRQGPPPHKGNDAVALTAVSAVLSTVIVLQAVGLWLAYSRSVAALDGKDTCLRSAVCSLVQHACLPIPTTRLLQGAPQVMVVCPALHVQCTMLIHMLHSRVLSCCFGSAHLSWLQRLSGPHSCVHANTAAVQTA